MRWRPVTWVYDRGIQKVQAVGGHGHYGLLTTEDHEFYLDGKGFAVPEPGDRWTSPTVFPEAVIPGLPSNYRSGRQNVCDVDSVDFMWLFGLYLAEGSCASNYGKGGKINRTTFSVNNSEVATVTAVLDRLGLNWNVWNSDKGSVSNIVINSKPLAEWFVANGGRGAKDKKIAPWVLGISQAYRQAVFDGATFGDGHFRNGGCEYSTASKALAFDMKLLAQSLGQSASVRKVLTKDSQIDGRLISGGVKYVVSMMPLETQKNRHVKIVSNRAVSLVKNILPVGEMRCWDLEVEEDHSYVAEGICVSNCGRSVGKSLSIKVRSFAFPFIHPGQEMVITAPEGNHLDAITDVIETAYLNTRLGREMLATGRRGGITHRPFHMNFANGSRIMGRIPQRDGKGVKGCGHIFTPIPTLDGIKFAKDVKVGDKVLTHEGRWSEVLYVEHDVNDCYKVEGAGSFPMIVSCDHRFMGASNLATPKQKRKFGPMYFEDVELLLDQQFYWATPTKFPYIEPEYPEFNNHSRPYNVESEEFWWLVGLYVADGYLRKNGKGDSDKCVNWISHPKNKGRAKLIRNLERLNFTYRITKRDHSSGDQVEVSSRTIADWLNKHIGRTATTKTLPMFMLSLPDSFKEAFLDGYLSGDGYWNESKGRWEAGSASKNLMIMIQLIAQSIGLTVGCTSVEPNVAEVNGKSLKKKPETSWRIYISDSGHAFKIGDYLVNKVKKITPVGKLPVVNIITDDHSYLSGSVMSHNIHPIWLELDEAQDYPDAGWIEIFETVKQGHEGAMWRAHGVTRGLRDYFYKFTQPDSGWSVHRYCLPGDTLVYGVDGPVPIAEIEPGTDVWAINEKGQLVTEQVTALIPNGKKVIWEVKTKGGYALRSTGNHPYLRLSNYGTRKTRRELRFEWVNAEDLKPGDYVVCVRDLPDVADPKPIPVSTISKMLQSYSVLREIPQSVWRASKETKIAFLCGYLMGDGSQTKQKRGQTPWSIGTSSYKMAKQLRALAHYCGLRCSAINVNDSITQILANSPQYRFYVYPEESWFNQIPNSYTIHDLPLGDEFVVRRVSSVRNTGIVEETYDISVGENHNFVAEGMVVHNTGMHRPTWTDEERQNQIAKYGSRDHPDYRRNVLGLHGDTTNPLFVLHRLMACFLEDTKILTPDGEKPIKDLQVADKIYNFLDVSEITDIHVTDRDEICEVVVNGRSIYCTPEHPFFTERGWVHADRLQPGERVFSREEILRMVQCGDSLKEEQAILLEKLYADLAWTNLSGFRDCKEDVQEM